MVEILKPQGVLFLWSWTPALNLLHFIHTEVTLWGKVYIIGGY